MRCHIVPGTAQIPGFHPFNPETIPCRPAIGANDPTASLTGPGATFVWSKLSDATERNKPTPQPDHAMAAGRSISIGFLGC